MGFGSSFITDQVELSESDFVKISNLVYDYCGINLHDGKKELVRARLAKRVRESGCSSFPDYLNYVESDKSGREFCLLVDAISTNLTSFFRENQHFDYLKNVFLPGLIARKQAKKDNKIRCWSAGCSTGEEPYSIAITLLDFLEGKMNWDIKILATDISTKVLSNAQEGIYDCQKVAPVLPALKHKYLSSIKTEHGQLYSVKDNLKKIVCFGRLNLMKEWPIKGPLDFIFCRNVMIYFDKQTQQKLVSRYYDYLDKGGILFTGHSESLTGIQHSFSYIQPTIYMKP